MFEISNIAHESVRGFECRILILKNGKVYACVSDLYKQLGVHKNTINSILSRSSDFESHIIKVNGSDLQFDNSNPDCNLRSGFQKGVTYQFIDDVGYNLLIQRIDPELVEDVEMRGQLVYIQEDMAGVYAKYNRKEFENKWKEPLQSVNVTPPQFRSPEQITKDKIDLGLYMAEVTGISKVMMLTVSISEAEKETGLDLSAYTAYFPPLEGDYAERHYGASELGKPHGDNGRLVNLLFQKEGYLTKDKGGRWILTSKGKEVGAGMYPFKNKASGRIDIYIRWPESMIDFVEEHADAVTPAKYKR